MPSLTDEIEATASGQDMNSTVETTSHFTQDPQHTQQHQQQYLQAGAISPGVTYSDEHYEQYDSDMEGDLDLGPSQETLHEGQILKSGYLHKKGERIKVIKEDLAQSIDPKAKSRSDHTQQEGESERENDGYSAHKTSRDGDMVKVYS